MSPDSLSSDWDKLLFGFPMIVLLIVGFFHLDEFLIIQKRAARPRRRPSAIIDASGGSMRTDPDGRSWDKHDSRCA